MSSTHSPSFGKTSLTSMPGLARFVNLNGEGTPGRSCPAERLSAYFSSAGLGSNVSTCDGPPPAKMWMTAFALRKVRRAWASGGDCEEQRPQAHHWH